MCGINGIIADRNEMDLKDRILRMNNAISHRGPDAQGIYCKEGYAFGHTRLSILDLSENGNQPMVSVDNRYIIVFNGEIFNFKTLRRKVKDYPFKSATDTEVLLALFMKYGISMIEELEGMFAIGIYDLVSQKLYLVRDRLGQKPIYYFNNNSDFGFSSEIRSLLSSKLIEGNLSHKALKNYVTTKTVFEPNTILKDIYMVPKGSVLIFKDGETTIKPYWRADNGIGSTMRGPYWRVQENVKKLFFESIEKRLISDVPIGAFLSGGIDSSCIVAGMRQVSNQTPKTIHVSFDEAEFSEAKYAEEIALKYKTDHVNIKLKPEDFLNSLPSALNAMDHPSNDGCNSFIVSQKTKEAGLTVALSGVGGDELFGGYPVFGITDKFLKSKILSKTPFEIRHWALKTLATVAGGSKAEKLKSLSLAKSTVFDIYKAFRSKNIDGHEFFESAEELKYDKQYSTSHVSMLELDFYLNNILLRDTDQMSMANQLEVRAPFLDHTLVEYVVSLPNEFKPLKPVKKLLIDSMGDLLPESIWNRKKMGFVFPWKYWVNYELKEFCLENLNWLIDNHVFSHKEIKPWIDSLELKSNPRGYDLWNYVVLGYWLRKNNINI